MSESEKKYGIDALKKVVDFGGEVCAAYESAKADGKVDWKDLPAAFGPGKALIMLAPVIGSIPKEFGDLDEAEKGELKQHAMEKFSLSDKKAEKLVEKSFGLAVEIGDLVEDILSGDAE